MIYFSVKHDIKFAGKTFIPCVCYDCPKDLELTVKTLAAKGKAVIYDAPVFFQNGKLLTVKKQDKSTDFAEKLQNKAEKAKKSTKKANKHEEIKETEETVENTESVVTEETEGF